MAAMKSVEETALIEQLQSTLNTLNAQDGMSHESMRKETLAVAKGIVGSLEKPEEVVMRYATEVWICYYIGCVGADIC